MCRIFYSLNVPRVRPYLVSFLNQSDHLVKNTPGIHNNNDADTHPHGFGFVAYNSTYGEWYMVNSSLVYKRVPTIRDIINAVSVSHVIIGHIRRYSGDNMRDVCIENTHPFRHGEHVFVHNGQIDQFSEYRAVLYSRINPEYYPCIKGNTDTEVIFYLFLTFLESGCPGDAMCAMVEWLKLNVDEFTLNCIYANRKHTVITRYGYSAHKRKKSPSLYWNGPQDTANILITSEPVMDEYTVIRAGTFLLIDHSVGKIVRWGNIG